LHVHPGLGAVQAGAIDRASYQSILSRLYGFHVPFETAAGIAPERSLWLAADLRALGSTEQAIAALPLCASLPRLDTAHRRLGARYVAEGSTLGGRELAKRLDHLFAPDERTGRRFFSGRDGETGKAWRSFCDLLDAEDADGAARQETIAAAIETFAAFEDWFADWKVAANAGG
jgi:heme oxygenase